MSSTSKAIIGGLNRALKRENEDLRSALQREISKNAALEFAYDRAFFEWCADRFVYAKGDQPTEPHVLRLRKMAGTRP
jgi:hypothetical protein